MKNSTRSAINDFDRETHERKMQAWREKYPFTSIIMSDLPYKDKLKYAEETFKPITI